MSGKKLLIPILDVVCCLHRKPRAPPPVSHHFKIKMECKVSTVLGGFFYVNIYVNYGRTNEECREKMQRKRE